MRAARWWLFAALLSLCPAAWAWEIASFETRVTIAEDATATVEETIVADFTGEARHGIYRDIPIHYSDRLGQHFVLRLRVRGVTNAYGQPWPYRLESSGRSRRIRIGDPDTTVTGEQTYRIVYDVERGAVRFFPDHDECYWNLTGNEWAVPIRRVRAELAVPMAATGVRAVAYLGFYGSTDTTPAEMRGLGRVVLEPSRGLQSYEGLTAAVAWDKGAVRPPTAWRVASWWLEDNWIYALPVLVLAAMLWLWHARGRDPRPVASQVVQYEPPKDLTPAEAGTLLDQHAHLRDITATIVDLAVRGHLKIQAAPGTWLSGSAYTLTRLEPGTNAWQTLKPHERLLLSGLFAGTAVRVQLSELKDVFYQQLPGIRDALYSELVTRGYLDSHPERVRRRYLIAGVILGIGLYHVLMVGMAWHQLPLGAILVVSLLSGIVVAAFSWVMPRRTLRGAHATDQLFGFLEFLRRADQDRLRRLNDPSLFERGLPYALAFGVVSQWARAFEGLYTQPPSWYQGDWDRFSARRFGDELDRSVRSMGQTLSSAPRSSGSWGGSGSGGGGFSGGGGGGGGGGAW